MRELSPEAGLYRSLGGLRGQTEGVHLGRVRARAGARARVRARVRVRVRANT